MPLTTHAVPRSHAEADDLLRRKCEIAARLLVIEGRLNDAICRATEIATAGGAEMKVEDAKIDRLLKQYFATLTPEQLGDRKSVKLNFGTFGKRAGREAVRLVRGWTWDQVIAALKSRGLSEYLRITEEVNRAAILAANTTARCCLQEVCGLRVEPGDTFYVEPNLKALEGYDSDPR